VDPASGDDSSAVLGRQDARAVCVRKDERVPFRQQAHRCRRVGGRPGRSGQIEELPPFLVDEAAQLHLEQVEARCDVSDAEPGERQ
jgi:hypothetical protein